ncbi:MAG: hypothetical protein K8R88_05050 [Armatimonadetes bacterium]|nr:hypothetical protein [Armatimonadota bacterium]
MQPEPTLNPPTHRGISIRIRKHPKRDLWEARLTLKKERKSVYGETYEQAEDNAKALIDATLDIETEQATKEASQTFAMFLADELGGLYSERCKNTRDQANWAINILIDELGEFKTRDLRLNHVSNAWRRIRAKYPKGGSQKVIRKYLSRALRLAVRYELLTWNYAEEIECTPVTKREYVPTVEDFRKLWLFHRDHHLWGPKFFLEGVLGVRDEEANAITADCIGENTLFVPGTKNFNAERTIALPERTKEILQTYAEGGRSLIRNVYGESLRETQNRDLKRAYELAGVPYAANHGLRHFFGQIEAAIGCPRSIRLSVLGHSATGDVGDLYVHPTPENVRVWMTKWEDHLLLGDQNCLPMARGTRGVRSRKLIPKG